MLSGGSGTGGPAALQAFRGAAEKVTSLRASWDLTLILRVLGCPRSPLGFLRTMALVVLSCL